MIKRENMKQLEPPNICYDRVFVILQDGKTIQSDNATIYLFDNQLSVVAKEGKAIFNFNNIAGVQCCNCMEGRK